MRPQAQTAPERVTAPVGDIDYGQAILHLIGELRRAQAKSMVHEMLLLQTFLRFADATGQRKEFAELVMANISADVKTTFANLRDDEVVNKEIASNMTEIVAELTSRVSALVGSPATHLRSTATRQ